MTAGEKRSCTLEASTSTCKLGLQTCQPEELKEHKKWGDCKPQTVTADEKGVALCADGLDNDCDGKTDKDDEDCKDFCTPGRQESCYSGPEGSAGKGICKAGFRFCGEDGKWGACQGEVKPKEDDCNGLDDDCNGTVDDGKQTCECDEPGKKEPCYTGPDGTQNKGNCAAGSRTCGADRKWGACEGQVTPGKETCNGVDDDCNGMVDDGLQNCQCTKPGEQQPCYSANQGTLNIGECKQGIQTCGIDGIWGSCVGEVTPSVEVCNRKDDDCDGAIDENLQLCVICSPGTQRDCYTGPQETFNEGNCKAGRQSCRVDGTWGPCTGSVVPQKEICNGLDDDCDGLVDEDFASCTQCKKGDTRPCYTGDIRTFQVGACKKGTQTCVEDNKWGDCQGEVKPKVDDCNGLDDDCDGFVDNVVGSSRLLTRTCFEGTNGCKGNAGGNYLCTGTCKSGLQTCTGSRWGVCLGATNPKPEVCNQLDDDCDGSVDEDNVCNAVCQTGQTRTCYEGPTGTKGVGVCQEGVQTCSNNQWGACQGTIYPSTEVCNQRDDDCNGAVDDGCYVWAEAVGDVSFDSGAGVATDSAGNVYLTGYYYGKVAFGTISRTAAGVTDVYIAKVDDKGQFLWVTSVGGPGIDIGSSVLVDASGNVYVLGRFSGTATFGSTSLTSKGDFDIFVVKLDATGKVLWVTTAGGTGGDYGSAIVLGASGLYLTGSFEGTMTYGSKSLQSEGSADVFVAKIDDKGQFLWAASAGGLKVDYGAGLTVDASGNVYVIGSFTDQAKFGSKSVTSKGGGDIFITRLDANGAFDWVYTTGGVQLDEGAGIVQDGKGNLYAIGFFKGTTTFGSKTFTARGESDVFVSKLDTSGNFDWTMTFGDTKTDYGSSIALGPQGNLHVTGGFEGKIQLGHLSFQSRGGGDVFIAKMDTQGKTIWATTGGGPSSDQGFGIAVDANGRVYVTGFFQGNATFGATTLQSKGFMDIFFLRLHP